MHRYHLGHQLGEGAFGQVCKATHKESGEQVAIKTLKDRCKDFDAMMALPEVKALRNISHENIVQCKELVLDSKGKVHMIFELLQGGTLESITRKRHQPFTESQIRSVFFQLLRAVCHMHAMSYMHRDIKPENILLQSCSLHGDIKIKVADLGLAKQCGVSGRPHTTYVATRWYRSPEILLRMASYSYPSDMWAVGAVMAEFVSLGEPLFPGDDEKDQLVRVVALRGHPAVVGWDKGSIAMESRRIRLPKTTPSSLHSAVPNASLPVLQLISDLLEMDPQRRPSAADALGYPLFIIHPENQMMPRLRKRRKLSSKDVDTGRTRDYPSSRWSGGSEGERREPTETRLQEYPPSGANRRSVTIARRSVVSKVPLKESLKTEGEKMFMIPQNIRNLPSTDAQERQDFGLRRPAGHFDMRA